MRHDGVFTGIFVAADHLAGARLQEDIGMGAAALYCPDLIDRCVAGDREAWRALHETYRPQALTFLSRLGVSPREAEDACQEVFLQIFRYLDRFERRADFRTWLYKLCISQAARLRRRAALLRPFAWLWGSAGEGVTLPEWSDGRAGALAERALAALRPRERTVFVLFELEGWSTADIARLVGAPGASVRRQLQEARRRFEAVIRDEPLEG
jgi:RNA polymerase sigma-70 factor (ECF subfamily)